jgi:ATP-dependent Clp protease ATP-binding subunit ClpC
VRLDVGGFAAWQALRAEAGLHVLETRVGDHELRRRVRVQVAPDPADATAAASSADTDTLVCRRYDDEPAPLVRDSVRGWRTGRLDRVLAGDFDLFS